MAETDKSSGRLDSLLKLCKIIFKKIVLIGFMKF